MVSGSPKRRDISGELAVMSIATFMSSAQEYNSVSHGIAAEVEYTVTTCVGDVEFVTGVQDASRNINTKSLFIVSILLLPVLNLPVFD